MDYDVIVVGGGPGGYTAAIRCAQHGLKTCLVERQWLGGTCLNEGCIPTKALLRSAEVLDEMRSAEKFGITGLNAAEVSIDIAAVQSRKRAVIAQLQSGIRSILRRGKVTILEGSAHFVSGNTLAVGGQTVSAKSIILATGSKAVVPASIRIEEGAAIVSSTELLDMEHVPQSAVIIGGGVVGIEFASMLNSFGSSVTVVEVLPEILPTVDAEIARLVRSRMEKSGVAFFLNTKVAKISGNTVRISLGGEEKDLQAEQILIAAGRVPNTDGLDVEKAGLTMDGKAVRTDEYMRTNVPGIYAIGDVNGKDMLAHMAMHEAIAAADNICGANVSVRDAKVPSCIYTLPEVASVGLTEKEAWDTGAPVMVGRSLLLANGKSLIEGAEEGLVKVLTVPKTGELLGVHICGPHAAEMIGGMAALMTAEATTAEVAASVFPHPSVSEALAEAFMKVEPIRKEKR